MYAVTVEFLVKPAHIEAFRQQIVENARASLDTEPGCRQFDVCTDPRQPQRIFLYELYDNEAAFQAHLQTPHFLAFNSASASLLESKAIATLERLFPAA